MLAPLGLLALTLACTRSNPKFRGPILEPTPDAQPGPVDGQAGGLDADDPADASDDATAAQDTLPPSDAAEPIDAGVLADAAVPADAGDPGAADAGGTDGPAPPVDLSVRPDAAPEATADLTPAPDLAADVASNAISVDDRALGTGLNQFAYGPGWTWCAPCNDGNVLYQDTNTWSTISQAQLTLSFQGTRIHLYGVLHPTHGIGAVSIDNGPASNVDFYAPKRAGNQLLWSSPPLAAGAHQLKVVVTGTHNAASTDNTVTLDRVQIE